MDQHSSIITQKAMTQLKQLYLCPISFQIMKQPYILKCGHTFEKQTIMKALDMSKKCPLCKKQTSFRQATSNFIAKQSIQFYIKQLIIKKQHINLFINFKQTFTVSISTHATGKQLGKKIAAKLGIAIQNFYQDLYAVAGTQKIQFNQMQIENFNLKNKTTIRLFAKIMNDNSKIQMDLK